MPAYRLYPLTSKGIINSSPTLVTCACDADALAVMNASDHPFGIDIWSDLRHVGHSAGPLDRVAGR